MLGWAKIPCHKADEIIREGIVKFYHDHNRGIEQIKKVVNSCFDNEHYVYNLGVGYYKNGNLKKASLMFNEAVKINSNFLLAKRAYAWTLVIGKLDIKKGIKISQSLSKKKKNTLSFRTIAYGYKLKKDDKNWKNWKNKTSKLSTIDNKINIDQYLQAIEKIENDPFLIKRLSILYTELGLLYERMLNFNLAADYFIKADSPFSWWTLGRLHAKNENIELAKKYFKRALNFSSGLNSDELKKIKFDLKNIKNPAHFFNNILNFIYPEKFNIIPGGEFIMGSSNGPKIEQPKHYVFVDRFLMGKYEVSNTEYKIYVDSTGYIPPYNCCKPKYDLWNKIRVPKEIMNKPVVNISWYDAVRYIGWKNKKFGKNYKLPTEAEWEKAARGTDERNFPWGNTAPILKTAYFGRHWDGLDTFVDVNSYENSKSPYGINNMAGSVWEWCFDWFKIDQYRKKSKKNSKGPSKGEFKVLRGGSWMNLSDYITTTFRNRNWPEVRYSGIGFRLAAEK